MELEILTLEGWVFKPLGRGEEEGKAKMFECRLANPTNESVLMDSRLMTGLFNAAMPTGLDTKIYEEDDLDPLTKDCLLAYFEEEERYETQVIWFKARYVDPQSTPKVVESFTFYLAKPDR